MSVAELMACVLARELRDGERCVVGGASAIPLAAALLAQRTHAPGLVIIMGSGGVNPRPQWLVRSGADAENLRECEAIFDIEDVFEYTENGSIDVAFFSGAQIDSHGSFNLTHVGGTLAAPAFRGPGLVNAGIPMTVGRTFLFAERHDRRTFVEEVDFASGRGHGRDAPRRRDGPVLCVTPLCVFDFPAPARRARVASVHPGVTLDAVAAATGFQPEASVPATTTTPSAYELAALREIDRHGALRSP